LVPECEIRSNRIGFRTDVVHQHIHLLKWATGYRPLAQSTARQGAMAAYMEAIELWIASSLTHMLFHGGPSRLDRRPKGTKADELCA
jgi:hypothetical protein